MTALKTFEVNATQLGGFQVEATARSHMQLLDQPSPLGKDAGSTPLEHLLMALAGCWIGTAHIVSRQQQIALRGVEVRVEGTMDTDYIAGKTREGRAGLTSIRFFVKLDCDLDAAHQAEFMAEVERRCSVLDNVAHATPIVVQLAPEPVAA